MTSSAFRPDLGFFRDAASRVFVRDGDVRRGLTPRGLTDFEALEATGQFRRAQADGRIVGTSRGTAEETAELPGGPYAAVLRHEVLPSGSRLLCHAERRVPAPL